MYRHWDSWEDGAYNHVFVADYNGTAISNVKDIMQGESFDSPQTPFGGAEDIAFDASGTGVFMFVKEKRKSGCRQHEYRYLLLYHCNRYHRKFDLRWARL